MENKRRIDFFFKDQYFYRAYYRIFPDQAIIAENGKYILNKSIHQIPAKFIDQIFLSHLIDGVKAWISEDTDKIQKDLNEILAMNKDKESCQPYKKFSQASDEYCQSAKWDFLCDYKKEGMRLTLAEQNQVLDDVTKIKEEDKDSIPSPILMQEVLTSKNFNAKNTFGMLEQIYLKENLVITSTIWKAALRSLNILKDSCDEIWNRLTGLKYKYNELIMEDSWSKLYQIQFIPNAAEKQKEFDLFMNSNHFRTLHEYVLLILFSDLFTDIEDYIQTMIEYDDLNYLLYGHANINKTYAHFIDHCTSRYSSELSESSKDFIYNILRDFDNEGHPGDKQYVRNFFKKHKLMEKYKFMLDDLGYCPDKN